MRKVFRDVVTVDEARGLLFNHFSPRRKTEVVPLHLAAGRVLAKDVYALTDVPPFDRATMDGYAVRAEDTFEAERIVQSHSKLLERWRRERGLSWRLKAVRLWRSQREL